MAFIKLATTDDIKTGKMERFDAGQTRILICNVEGEFFAVDDNCTHEDASLYLGALHGDVVKCSLHGGKFNVRTGEPVEEPACVGLRTYAIELRDGDIYVDIDG
ncbi:MAG: non-heme iron oxygenase ferredoxin subunit [Gammaproteobacteria bacterium]|nr:non-heme iron oxygenase ferredoxin subunit [Gammaproteobacteria bacterium]